MFEFFAFALVNLLGVISPGPDFAIVTRYGLEGSRKSAFLASLGITTAILIHILYCMMGVAVFLQSSPSVFHLVQIVGALYLGYLGLRLVFPTRGVSASSQRSSRRAFAAGFLTNLLNPKVTLFLLSLFSQFITPETPLSMKIAFAVTIPVTTFGWFGLLSYLLTHPSFLPHLQRRQRTFTIIMGAILILLSLTVIGNCLSLSTKI